jgi:outer membrane receptor protein involved in Fe transport
MRLSTRIAGALLSLLIVQAAWSANTGKISGKVTDAKKGDPLPGVNILLVGTKMGGVSDPQGDYYIANVPSGTYTLRASQVGYQEIVIRDIHVRPDATTELSIKLSEVVLDLGQEVVITAQRPLVEKDNTASRVFIESADIEKRPANELADVVLTLPSINVESGVMKVRGGTLNEVSFIVDGARARNPMNQDPYTNINLSSIQDMEIITGSFNAEYGEARSGIFNIITKEGGEKYTIFIDGRYTPPGVKHWGPSLYDYSSPLYWENSHARHQQWWIDYPNMWVDPNGLYGNDPSCSWTPQQAYNNYMATHQPLQDYTKTPGYSVEMSLGGPVPIVSNANFFFSGKYRVEPPVIGNSYLDKGQFFDGTAKITHQIDPSTKLQLSGFMGTEKTSWGIGSGIDGFWAQNYALNARYAYYDWAGYPTTMTNGQTLKLTHLVDQSTMWEAKLVRVYAHRKSDVLPGDPVGWDASGPANRDYLRAFNTVVDSNGKVTTIPIGEAYQNVYGYNTTGYYNRYDSKNTDLTASGYYQSQVNKNMQLKAGGDFTYYTLNQYNESKFPARIDAGTYHPYQGDLFAQSKLEFGGFIMNLGFRLDFYNPNDTVYEDVFNPMTGGKGTTKMFYQLSPRLGISHPIDEYTVLHFSYGHFFERSSFGDYGEGNSEASGSLTKYIVTGSSTPWVLGNRNVKPEKTVAYELGIERNFFDIFTLTVTAFYKDIRNTLRSTTIQAPDGTYRTNANGNYADVRGVEIALRKQATRAGWGTTWGYFNFTTQTGIYGFSGDPVAIGPGYVIYGASGDFIQHNNPRLKAGFYYETPDEWDFLAGIFKNISFTVDYQARFANDQLLGDYFEYGGKKYLLPADQNTNLKLRKDVAFGESRTRLGLYLEVRNLFNNKWFNLSTFEQASMADQGRFATSNFKEIPQYDRNGEPILPMTMYRNLPRQIIFGATFEL